MLMRTDPFRELDRLTDQMTGTFSRPASMPMDAYRDEHQFVVQVDLPGVEPDAIEVTVEKNVLNIHAERRAPAPQDAERIVGERRYGSFSRQLFLGDTLDTEKLEAGYANGVLTLTIPVAEAAKPRRIAVNSSTEPREIKAG